MSCCRCSHEEFRFDSESWLMSRERYESFWRGEMVDRPLLCVTSPKQNTSGQAGGDVRPRDPDELFRWYTDPDRVIPRLEQEIENTHYAGDAFPCVFPVSCSLVAIQAAYLGARYYVNHDSGSGWSEPIITEWVSLLKRIQDAGKLLVLSCNPAEVDVLLSALRPEGVLLSTRCRTVDEADALLNHVVRRFK